MEITHVIIDKEIVVNINNISIKEWNKAFYYGTKINTPLHLKSIYFLRKYFYKFINKIKREHNVS
tara:strand:- start:687 stop:881 length:195 start_codon:yes stop_codon:yes gene_type:complete